MIDVDLRPEALFSLHGRVAVVTGASSGLGVAFAEALHAAGATVVISARRAALLDAIAGGRPRFDAIACDVSDVGELQSLVAGVEDRHGRIDILVNNAGSGGPGKLAQSETDADTDAVFDVNLRAPMRLSRLAFPVMRRTGGSIINVTSISGLVGIGQIPQAGYVASKHALTGLTRELALEWARFGIRVNALAPGFFATEMTRALREASRHRDWIVANTPLPAFADPARAAGALLLLASDAGSYITSETIAIDGGWTAR
jgi:NAD(P)-dependent dehydrogenase (short-subunit alcohol dehydrogenase family)